MELKAVCPHLDNPHQEESVDVFWKIATKVYGYYNKVALKFSLWYLAWLYIETGTKIV
jgi:hypothetical protein